MGKCQIISKKHVGWETRVGEQLEREIARVWLAVTTNSDLPTKYALAGITIQEGSRAWDITNGVEYGYVEGTGWCLQKNSAAQDIVQIKGTVESVSELPSDAEPGWLYFVKPTGATTSDEYVYTIDGEWDQIGSTAITITVDSAMSSVSENPVQNKVITSALGDKADKTATVSTVTWDNQNGKLTKTINGTTTDVMTTDATPTDGSKNPVQSDGVYDALAGKADSATTIAGYGITDAKIESGTITLGLDTITPLTSSDVASTYSPSGTAPVNGTAITDALDPISETEYSQLVTKDRPLYFIYED